MRILNIQIMKKYTSIFIALLFLYGLNACDDHFEEVNTNPNGISDVDPAHLFATGARASFRSGVTGFDYQIASQMAHFYVGVFAPYPIRINRSPICHLFKPEMSE